MAGRVRWVCEEPRDLLGRAPAREPWVVIWGRDQYEVSVERLPIRNWFEARRAAQLLKAEGGWSMVNLGEWRDSYRPIFLYRIKPSAAVHAGAPFWLYETQLLSNVLERGRVFSIARFGFKYFLSSPDRSQVAGSLIDDPQLFALSAGASEAAISESVLAERDLFGLLTRGLSRMRTAGWIQAFNPTLLARTAKLMPSAVGASVVVLLCYLSLSTAYLIAVKTLREKQLADLGSEVGQLLRSQREMDVLSKRVNAVVTVVNSRVNSFKAWSLVPLVWDSGGVVYGLAFKDGRVIVRGSTADATALLSKVSQNDSFSSVKFEAPLRESSGRQDFSIGVGISEAKSP